jgi:hypothetical protein
MGEVAAECLGEVGLEERVFGEGEAEVEIDEGDGEAEVEE